MDNNKKIQVAAYYLWQNSGCPNGRSDEFWYKAISQMTKMPKSAGKKETIKKENRPSKKVKVK